VNSIGPIVVDLCIVSILCYVIYVGLFCAKMKVEHYHIGLFL